MSRRRKQAYRVQELSELARQLRYAPPEKRAELVCHAEQLHDEIDPGKNYPIDFVVYRLTDRRVPPSENVMLVGEAMRPDLRLLIDALSRSIDLPPDAEDPGETAAELADRLGVSTKTIGRWRDAGLRWRWVVRGPGERPTVVIQRSALGQFSSEHSGRVSSAAAFDRLSDADKHALIRRARRLADATDAKPTPILAHLSRRTSRSVEALRVLIAAHDKQHPGQAVFADRAGPLSVKQKRVIDRAYRRGIGVATLCARFRKTRSTIYRAIHEARAERALSIPLDVVTSPMFERDDADEVILRAIKPTNKARRLDRSALNGLPEAIRVLYDRPITPDPTLRSWIVRYNFLKHRAVQAQSALRSPPIRAADLDRFDELYERAGEARGQVVAGMLPVVLSVVRRQLAGSDSPEGGRLIMLLLIGNRVLLDEVERFDPALSHRFESVLTNRLLRVLAQPAEESVTKPVTTQCLITQLERAGVPAAPS